MLREGVPRLRGQATSCLSVSLVSQLVNRRVVQDVLAQPRGVGLLCSASCSGEDLPTAALPGRRGEPRTDGRWLRELLQPSPAPTAASRSPEGSRAARAGQAACPPPSPRAVVTATAPLRRAKGGINELLLLAATPLPLSSGISQAASIRIPEIRRDPWGWAAGGADQSLGWKRQSRETAGGRKARFP